MDKAETCCSLKKRHLSKFIIIGDFLCYLHSSRVTLSRKTSPFKKKNDCNNGECSQLRVPHTGSSVSDAQSPGQSVQEAKQLAKQGLSEVGFDHRGVKYL